MGKNLQRSPSNIIDEPRRLLSYWWQVMRWASITGAALSILITVKDGQFVEWTAFYQSVLNGWFVFTENVFQPLENAINTLFEILGWQIELGPLFKPSAFTTLAIIASSERSPNDSKNVLGLLSAYVAYGFLFIVALLIGILPVSQFHSDAALFLFTISSFAGTAMLLYIGGFVPPPFGIRRWMAVWISRDMAFIIVVVFAFLGLNAVRFSA